MAFNKNLPASLRQLQDEKPKRHKKRYCECGKVLQKGKRLCLECNKASKRARKVRARKKNAPTQTLRGNNYARPLLEAVTDPALTKVVLAEVARFRPIRDICARYHLTRVQYQVIVALEQQRVKGIESRREVLRKLSPAEKEELKQIASDEALMRGLEDEVAFNAARIAVQHKKGTGEYRSVTSERSGNSYENCSISIVQMTDEQLRTQIEQRRALLLSAGIDTESQSGTPLDGTPIGAPPAASEHQIQSALVDA